MNGVRGPRHEAPRYAFISEALSSELNIPGVAVVVFCTPILIPCHPYTNENIDVRPFV